MSRLTAARRRATQAWRDAASGALVGALGGRGAGTPAEAAARVLFLRQDKIGDMVTSTAVLRALAAARPGRALDVVASPANAPVLDGIDEVRAVHVLRGGAGAALRLGLALRARRYDAVVDGLVLSARVSPTSVALMAGCGAPVRVGMGGGRQQQGVYTRLVPPAPPPPGPLPASHVEHLAQLVLAFGGDPAAVGHPTLALSAAERAAAEAAWAAAAEAQAPAPAHHALGYAAPGGAGPRLLVNLSAGHPQRRWPDAHFAEALRAARGRHPGLVVGVLGEPREAASVRAVAAAAGAAPLSTPGVRAAFALVAAADAVLTPDTAVAHAASAFRRPCVTLMLPGAEPFAPYRTPGRLVLSPSAQMDAVTVGRVVGALDAVLAGARA